MQAHRHSKPPFGGLLLFRDFFDSALRHMLAGTFSGPFKVTEKRSRATSAFADRLSTNTNQWPPITPSQEVVA
jgi:hypothetical protein